MNRLYVLKYLIVSCSFILSRYGLKGKIDATVEIKVSISNDTHTLTVTIV